MLVLLFLVSGLWQNSVSLLILESLYIFKNKPVLNDVNKAFPLNIVK